MERPQALANTWLIFQTIGFIIALDGVAEFFSVRHYHHLVRQSFLLGYYFLGLERDPAQPSLPESWEEWYNS
jgi:hypothetical protein